MLRIENLVFDAWGRRFFEFGERRRSDRRQSRPGGTERRRQVDAVQADRRRSRGAERRDRAAEKRPDRLGRSGTSGDAGHAHRHHLGRRYRARDAQCRLGDRRARRACRDLSAAQHHRCRSRAGARRRNPDRARLFQRRSHPADGRILRRLAHAGRARGGALCRARSASARRADQLSRPRRRALARGAAEKISAHRLDRQPRPRASQQFGRRHFASEPRQARALLRRLQRFRDAPRREEPAAGRHQGQAGRRARPFAEIHRPFPRQGQQGDAGAVAHQAAGQARADRRSGRGTRYAVYDSLAEAAAGAAAPPARKRVRRL